MQCGRSMSWWAALLLSRFVKCKMRVKSHSYTSTALVVLQPLVFLKTCSSATLILQQTNKRQQQAAFIYLMVWERRHHRDQRWISVLPTNACWHTL